MYLITIFSRNLVENQEILQGMDTSAKSQENRSKYLIQKAKEIESITNCKVALKIYPTWGKGKVKSYVSAGLDVSEEEQDGGSPIPSMIQTLYEGLGEHFTPLESTVTSAPGPSLEAPPRKRLRMDQNICQICRAEYISEDIDSHWVQCAENCNYRVHATCCGIYYKNDARDQKNLEKWSKKHFFCKEHMPSD